MLLLTFCGSFSTDIRKPATRKAQIQRPLNSHSNSATNTPSDGASHDTDDRNGYTEPVSDDEGDEDNRHHSVAKDEAAWADLPAQAAAQAKAYRDSNAGKVTPPSTSTGSKKLQEIFPKLTPANLTKLLDSKYEMERDRGLNESGEAQANGEDATVNPSSISLRPGRVEYVSSFRAQPGKKIAIPVRVEPKVFFANERTSESDTPDRPSRVLFTHRNCLSQPSRGSSSRSSSAPLGSESCHSRTLMVRPSICSLPRQ